ncbi:MAG: hypothetical protein LBE75_06475 [Burkholderiales bacterium]|jgi:hypothetical protein|nr:hypothetical protein [Burkholderiales bacterium]
MGDTSNTGLAEVFAAGGDAITVGGESFDVKPANLGQIARALKSGSVLFSLWKAEQEKAKANGRKPELLGLIINYPDHTLNTVAALTGKPREWLDGLQLDEAAALAIRLFEVNLDFFTNRLPMLMEQFSARIEQMEKTIKAGSGASSA